MTDAGGVEPLRADRELSAAAGHEPQSANQALLAKMRQSPTLGTTDAARAEPDVSVERAPRRPDVDHARDRERGEAFDTLGRDQALARFPELDAAYHQLAERTALSTEPAPSWRGRICLRRSAAATCRATWYRTNSRDMPSGSPARART
ncbi:hypothetical protein [Burkholderia glumae]|uniref:hypothetical protein n=1 Tax=Burkholderia glumae TaxID=337 RepID=UPI00214FAD30|nr:hypothetical protein [Burkholderia glumae]